MKKQACKCAEHIIPNTFPAQLSLEAISCSQNITAGRCETHQSASHYFEEFESMLRPLSEVREMDDSIGKVVSYQDQKLAGSERLYAGFVHDLDRRGLLCWSQSHKVQCSCFFVRNMSSASGAFLRIIVDSRPANRKFKKPLSTVLASPESLARIQLGESNTFNVSTLLCQILCFYRIRVPQHVASYFALPPLMDSYKGRSEVLVWPCVAALPMKSSWTLWFAQDINRAQLLSTGRV